MTQSLIIGFSSILVTVLFFRIYKIVSTECLTAIITIIMLVFIICKIIAEKAIHADYNELIEKYKESNKVIRKDYEEIIELYKENDKKKQDLLEKCKNNF